MEDIEIQEVESIDEPVRLWYLPLSALLILASLLSLVFLRHYIFPAAGEKHEREKALEAIGRDFSEARFSDLLTKAEWYMNRWPVHETVSKVNFYVGMAEYSLRSGNKKEERARLERAYDAFRKSEMGLLDEKERRIRCGSLCVLSEQLDRPAEEKVNVYNQTIEFFPELGKIYMYQLAEAYANMKPPRHSKALKSIREYLKITTLPKKDRAKALLLESRIYIRFNRPEDFVKAENSLKKILKLSVDKIMLKRVAYQLGSILDHSGKVQKATEEFIRLVKMEPADTELDNRAAFHLGKYELADGKLDKALKRFNAIVKSDISGQLRAAAMVKRIENAILKKEMDAARDLFFELLDAVNKRDLQINDLVAPSDIRTVFDRIFIYYRDKLNYAELQNITDKSLKADYLRLEDAFMTKGLILMHQADVLSREAGRLTKEAKKAAAHKSLISARQKYEDAAKTFDNLIGEDVGRGFYTKGLYNGGKARYYAGLYRSAIPLLEKYVSVTDSKGLVEARYMLGRCHQNMGEFVKAIIFYSRNIESHPNHTYSYDSRYEKGICMMSLGQYAGAVKVFMGIIDDPQRAFLPTATIWKKAALSLADALYLARDYKNAWVWLENTVVWYPDQPNIIISTFNLGNSLLEAARVDAEKREDLVVRAKHYFTRVIKMGAAGLKDREIVLRSSFYIGDADTLAGDYSSAVQSYNRAINRFPDTIDSVRGLVKMANCYYYLNQLQRAGATYERAEWSYKKHTSGKDILDEPWVELAVWRKTSAKLSTR